ncbi:hypothetical protein YPPY113_2457, partial [Yersinia pestis PY-113]
MSKRN